MAELTSELNSAFTSTLCLTLTGKKKPVCVYTELLYSTQNETFKDSNGILLSSKALKLLRVSKNAFEGKYESRF